MNQISTIQLSNDQKTAIAHCLNFIKDSNTKKIFRVSGPAGTGKTSIIKQLTKELDVLDIRYEVLTPTNKAKSVLKSKLIVAKTIHEATLEATYTGALAEFVRGVLNANDVETISELIVEHGTELELIHIPKEKIGQLLATDQLNNVQNICFHLKIKTSIQDKFLSFEPRDVDPDLAAITIAIVDEGSMVGTELYEKFSPHYCQVIMIGDANQLPPVLDQPLFFLEKPDVTLQEIFRSELGVVEFAHNVLKGAGVLALPPGQYDAKAILEGRQIVLTHRNSKRLMINKQIRKELKFKGNMPRPGELILLRKTNSRLGIFTNQIARVVKVPNSPLLPYTLYLIDADREVEIKLINEDFNTYGAKDFVPFRFAYCITVHSAQGGEWDDVFINEQDTGETFSTATQWLYTAVTRAKHSVFRFAQKTKGSPK